MLEVRELVCGYPGGGPVIGPVSFRVERGEVLCLLGPNGVGKTTLLKTILGALKPLSGGVYLHGRAAGSYTIRAFAREAAYVPQSHVPPFPYTVRDVVVMGRNPHMHEFSSPGREDLLAAEKALAELDALHLADRDYTRLSGGERQLVLIARALAQEARLLVLDEPAAHLDYGNEARVLERVKSLSRKGYGVLLVTHAPGQAFLWADRAAVVGRDGFFAVGEPEAVLTEEVLSRLYGVDVQLVEAALRDGRRVKVCLSPGG